MSLEKREQGTDLSQEGLQKCTCIISSTQRSVEEFAGGDAAIGFGHPETPLSPESRGEMQGGSQHTSDPWEINSFWSKGRDRSHRAAFT